MVFHLGRLSVLGTMQKSAFGVLLALISLATAQSGAWGQCKPRFHISLSTCVEQLFRRWLRMDGSDYLYLRMVM